MSQSSNSNNLSNLRSCDSSITDKFNLKMANPANLSFTAEQLINLLITSNTANAADKG